MGYIQFYDLNLVAQARIFTKCGDCTKSSTHVDCSICYKSISPGDVVWKYKYNRRDNVNAYGHHVCVLKYAYKDVSREICDKVQKFLNMSNLFFYGNPDFSIKCKFCGEEFKLGDSYFRCDSENAHTNCVNLFSFVKTKIPENIRETQEEYKEFIKNEC